ncbi:eukaryotic rRNA processing protein EBP2-domain-containing protein [Cokeromyces recurvatus]|uniref:eukaryotic rRNA processing protein EBP2-domain-containing protein n=1 Tax=Cokeromyces recurvatus TaxID=90255 RepID=UPI0022205953|nr:eukaryotic rRNA processing protein EBP2-domain-containing protein [Cokeromyces recurvatus]KAI7903685.1 eukaryotic rRNA processing protein EBP2-domain-containing protein [Cokeromyces recurvatus]
MSRKTERAARKANKKTKKATEPTVEKKEIERKEEEEDLQDIIIKETDNDINEDEKGEEVEQDNDENKEAEQVNDDDDGDEQDKSQTRITRARINDEAAMIRITDEFKLKDLPWIETMTVTSSEPVIVEDSTDDMKRELAFYQQALEAAKVARDLVKKAGIPFSRPEDYFAEMLKSDEHMAKVRQKLLDESAAIKASEEAKRQRQLKKFGKKVQAEKQLERQKQKAEMLDKIKLLKRKRKDGEDLTVEDDFDIALEKADKRPAKSLKRINKDRKYGFGGKKGRFAKSNTAESSAELGGYNKMKGKPIFKGKGKKAMSKK